MHDNSWKYPNSKNLAWQLLQNYEYTQCDDKQIDEVQEQATMH